MKKRFEEDMDIEPQQIDMGNISDGYHTFNELYEHRSLLYLAWMLSDGRPGDCYWIADHFEGWDLLVCGRGNIKSPATQISYHIPVKYREYLQKAFPCINKEEYIWDGHTSDDVLERIKTWMKHDLARW